MVVLLAVPDESADDAVAALAGRYGYQGPADGALAFVRNTLRTFAAECMVLHGVRSTQPDRDALRASARQKLEAEETPDGDTNGDDVGEDTSTGT